VAPQKLPRHRLRLAARLRRGNRARTADAQSLDPQAMGGGREIRPDLPPQGGRPGGPPLVGAFAVAIHGGAALANRFAAEKDDYRSIMVRALADRLAEAFAERLHEVARREWYAPEESRSGDELIGEHFRGIRPAYGYPACPDHSEKRTLLTLLDAERAGIGATESFATTPAASVSGLYFGHPQARYFSVGRVGRDQIEDYARRKGMSIPDVERWLRPNLAYEPRDA